MTSDAKLAKHDDQSAQIALIAAQNDTFRQNFPLGPIKGRIVMTCGIADRPAAFQAACVEQMRHYTDFNEDIDPDGTHGMGRFEIDGEIVWFKVDLYDPRYEYGSEDPADPDQTRRVLTILFPSEY